MAKHRTTEHHAQCAFEAYRKSIASWPTRGPSKLRCQNAPFVLSSNLQRLSHVQLTGRFRMEVAAVDFLTFKGAEEMQCIPTYVATRSHESRARSGFLLPMIYSAQSEGFLYRTHTATLNDQALRHFRSPVPASASLFAGRLERLSRRRPPWSFGHRWCFRQRDRP